MPSTLSRGTLVKILELGGDYLGTRPISRVIS